MIRTIRLSFLVAALCSLAATAHASPSRGEVLAQRGYAECHATKPGQQSPNPKAPSFPAVANEPSATEYSLRVFLKISHATMPNFKIEPDDINDLVDYIRSLKPQPGG
jgi:mono/diheme cytochrome c family protein